MAAAGYFSTNSASGGTWRPAQPQRQQDSLFQVVRRLAFIFLGMSVITPLLCISAPILITIGQVGLGIGLAFVTWVIVKYPTEKAKERLASDRVQPEMHLMLGTLLPELAGYLEKLFLWIDLALRRLHCPAILRYPILNFVAWSTGPLWFSLLMLALVFLLLVFTVISFGLILPFAIPLAGLLLGYSLLVPLWVFSVYFFSAWPLIISTCVGMYSEAILHIMAIKSSIEAKRMVRASAEGRSNKNSATGAVRGSSSPMSQRNPNTGGAWLSKQELLALYVRHGYLDSEMASQIAMGGAPAASSAAPAAQAAMSPRGST